MFFFLRFLFYLHQYNLFVFCLKQINALNFKRGLFNKQNKLSLTHTATTLCVCLRVRQRLLPSDESVFCCCVGDCVLATINAYFVLRVPAREIEQSNEFRKGFGLKFCSKQGGIYLEIWLFNIKIILNVSVCFVFCITLILSYFISLLILFVSNSSTFVACVCSTLLSPSLSLCLCFLLTNYYN